MGSEHVAACVSSELPQNVWVDAHTVCDDCATAGARAWHACQMRDLQRMHPLVDAEAEAEKTTEPKNVRSFV